MEQLKQLILDHATVPKDGVLKVDGFLNHIIDPQLILSIGKEFAQRFSNCQIDKILTLESSGIAPALGLAIQLNVPVLFAKKSQPSTLNSFYQAEAFSFTKNISSSIIVSKEFIQKDENILIIDDFLAMGSAALALNQIILQAQANCVGIGIVIEKSFQAGRQLLNNNGIRVESLVQLKSVLASNLIEFL